MHKTLLIVSYLALAGCATTTAFDPEAFAGGDLRFDCRRSACADRFRQQQSDLLAKLKQHDWTALAQKLGELNVDSKLSYYLLGRAAEGLGNTAAAMQYYQRSGENTSEIGKNADIDLPSAAWSRFDALKRNRHLAEEDTLPVSTQTPTGTANSLALEKVGNVFYVPVLINDSEHNRFVIDTGAAESVITADLLLKLTNAGTVSPNDLLKPTLYRTADGKGGKAARVNLKALTIGDRTLRNVTCLVLDNFHVDLLLGQNALQKLGNFKFDYKNQRLILED